MGRTETRRDRCALICLGLQPCARRNGVVGWLQPPLAGQCSPIRETAMKFIRLGEVVEMVGVSRTTIFRMVQRGVFPKPVQLAAGGTRYVLEAVQEWMRAQAEGTPWQSRANAHAVRSRSTRIDAARLALSRRPRALHG
jgi:prophage regulatory protein